VSELLPADPLLPQDLVRRARLAVDALAEWGLTLATAESLTGGLLGALVTAVPGSSAVYRGGVVAYATDLKHDLLGVDGDLLERVGAVDADVAVAMARGVRERLRADVGVATTGVAGPGPQDGHPAGTVWVALATPARAWAVDAGVRSASGADRAAVRAATCRTVLDALLTALTPAPGPAPADPPTGEAPGSTRR
jgi:nicotinamide-nucleotide amidase